MSRSLVARIIVMQFVTACYLLLRYYFHIPPDMMRAGSLALLLITAIGWPIRFIVGRYLSHGTDVDTTAFKIVAGVNLVAWLVPVVGMALSTMTLQLSKRSDASKLFFWSLAAIGGWGAMINAGISGANQFRFDQIQASCSAAMPSDWTPQEKENFCVRGIRPASKDMPA